MILQDKILKSFIIWFIPLVDCPRAGPGPGGPDPKSPGPGPDMGRPGPK